jgi:hypothetical protein
MHLSVTSFSFGVVAMLAQGDWKCPAFVVMMGLSMIYHAKLAALPSTTRTLIAVADRGTAHLITVATVWEAMRLRHHRGARCMLMPYTACLLWVVWVYYIGAWSHLPDPIGMHWHGTTHVASSIGTLCLHRAKLLAR